MRGWACILRLFIVPMDTTNGSVKRLIVRFEAYIKRFYYSNDFLFTKKKFVDCNHYPLLAHNHRKNHTVHHIVSSSFREEFIKRKEREKDKRENKPPKGR